MSRSIHSLIAAFTARWNGLERVACPVCFRWTLAILSSRSQAALFGLCAISSSSALVSACLSLTLSSMSLLGLTSSVPVLRWLHVLLSCACVAAGTVSSIAGACLIECCILLSFPFLLPRLPFFSCLFLRYGRVDLSCVLDIGARLHRSSICFSVLFPPSISCCNESP